MGPFSSTPAQIHAATATTGLSPWAPTSRAPDDVEVGVELLDYLGAVLPRPRCHVALPFLEAKLQRDVIGGERGKRKPTEPITAT